MVNEQKILRRIEVMEAMAHSFLDEATQLKRELGVVSTSPVLKGRRAQIAAKVLENFEKNIARKTKTK